MLWSLGGWAIVVYYTPITAGAGQHPCDIL